MAKKHECSRSSQESHFLKIIGYVNAVMGSHMAPEDHENIHPSDSGTPGQPQDPPLSPEEVYDLLIAEIINGLSNH